MCDICGSKKNLNSKALIGLCIALLLPVGSYLIMKHYGDNAVNMPRRYYVDTVINKVVNGKEVTDTVWHKVANITLTNQLGKKVSLDDLEGKINHWSKDKILESLKKNIDLPDYDVTSFNYQEMKSEKPAIDEELQLVANNYASVSGKRMFVIPNILNRNNIKLKAEDERKYDIDYPSSFTDNDTITIKIPVGYNIESMPKDVVINNKFGDYEIHFKVNGENVSCTRMYKRSEGRFPAIDYTELVKFYDSMYKADRSRIVFVKKE